MPVKLIALVVATAYCACPICCAPHADGITAMGTTPREGHTIAGPPHWPLGTEVLIEDKRYVVEDRGGAITGNRIDIYFEDHDDALRFGRREIEVQIMSWGGIPVNALGRFSP